MNLEELISKYLDGDMLEAEDELLRKKLSEDASARMKFDSAVNIHIACKEDSESIFPTDELVEKTEDMILMRIFAKAPEPQKKKALVWFNTPMLAAMIALFMFLFVAEISNLKQFNEFSEFNEFNNNYVSGVKEVQRNVSFSKVDRVSGLVENKIISRVGREDLASSGTVIAMADKEAKLEAIVVVDKQNEVNSNNSNKVANIDLSKNISDYIPSALVQPQELLKPGIIDGEMLFNEQAKELIASSDVEHLPPSLEYNNNFSLTVPVMPAGNPAGMINNRAFNDYSGVSNIQVASFFGTDVLRVGIEGKQTVVSHFSQSVAYPVSASGRVGIELGYTEYVYNDEAVVNIKSKIGGGTTGVESYEGGYDFSYTYPYTIKMKNNKQMLWSSAFYENTLYQTSGFALVGRVGAGGSSDGPLGYGRVFAQYTVFNGFNLTLGAEGRMFSAEIPKFVKSNDKIKTTATIIYGFQFQF